MPSSLEAMIQNMIQAGIPQAQMMQLLQTMQASANNNNNISSPTINGTTTSSTNSSIGVLHNQTASQTHQQHFSLTNNQNSNQSSSVVASSGGSTTVAGAHQAAAAVAAAASLQQLATLQHQQQQILAAHHQQQQQFQQQQSTTVNNPTASAVAAIQQAHAGTASAGQQQSAIHSTALMQQMAAVAAAVHPHSHQSTNTTAGLQAVMQQHLQQSAVAAASAASSATHPMAAALAQASGKNAQFVASMQQQHHQQQQQSGGNTGVSVSLPPGMAVTVQHPQLASNVGQNVSSNNVGGQLVPSLATPSLAWPIFQPIVNIPFFDMATYQKVNLDVQPSAMANGMDLPLNDINTLRFFFNFGVQHARAILLRQHINSQQQQQQQQIALLHNAGTGTQTGQERMNNANEQLQLQQKLLMQQSLIKAQSDAAASINEKSANLSNTANSGGANTNNAAVAAAQLLHGGIVGFQNQLQMNQLAGLMANQQSQQNAKLVSISGTGGGGVDSSSDLNSGNVGTASQQQLRSSSTQQNTSQQQNQLTAMQQLLLQQQQQQQLTAALAAQQQEQQQTDGGVVGNQRQTPLNELVRSHFLNSNGIINNGNNNGNSVNRTPNSTPSNHSNIQGNGHGGGSTNGTPRPVNGRNSVNNSQQQTTLSGNSSVSPKTGSVGVPTDPAPRKQSSMIISNPLNTELSELKQRGLNALRSPETMSDGLQKRLVEMAATLNSAVIAPMATGGGGGGGNGSNIISTGGACNGTGNSVPPAVLLQQQQQIYQHQHQLLQQQLLQQQLIQAQQQQQQNGLTSQNQQNSMANNFSNVVSNQRSQSNNGQQQPGVNTSLLQSMIPSAEIDGTPSLLTATEMHYTETFRQEGGNRKTKPDTPGRQPPDLEVGAGLSQRRKSGVYMLGMNIKEEIGVKSTNSQSTTPSNQSMATSITTTAISTSAMMNYMNNMLTTARSHLQGQGVGIYYDQNGNQIDYSSRPIDPIFRRAREELSHSPGSNLSSSNANASVANNNSAISLAQASNVSSIGENTLTTSAVGGDLGILSRTCLIGISDNTNRRSSIGGPQQLAGAQPMTVQQPIPLATALYPGNLTPQQLQQHYFQLQQQQQQLQQLQQFQQLQAQIQQQQQLQLENNNNTLSSSLDGNKKRVLNASYNIGSEEGPSSAKSARSSVGNSSDLVIDNTNSVNCSSVGQNEEVSILTGTSSIPSNNDGPINIIDINNSDSSSKQKLNESSEDDDFNENDDNSINVLQENEEEDKSLEHINNEENNSNNNTLLTNIRAHNEEIDSPSNGKQLRIVEDEEDDQ